LDRSLLRADRCPVCLSPRIRTARKGTFDSRDLDADQIKITDREYGKVWDLDRCGACGHLFANPYPSPEFLLSLYDRVEDPLYQDEAEGRSDNFSSVLNKLETFRPEKGELLDAGAATGILCALARSRGWAVDGVEPSLWAVRTAEEKYGLKLRHGSLEDAPLPEGRYAAVTMIDLIEHTPRPRDAAAAAGRALAPGGILCVVTPDIHSFAARAAGRRWWHFRPGHLAYFSAGSLDSLLTGAGFRILARRRYSWTFSVRYLLSRFGLAARRSGRASFLGRVRIKLALGDSFEVYAVKGRSR
jgi:SAM-dependent methyltransferase